MDLSYWRFDDVAEVMKKLFEDDAIFGEEKGLPKNSGACAQICVRDMVQFGIYFSPEENFIGTKLSIFLSTFICRTKSFCDALVDVELIQKSSAQVFGRMPGETPPNTMCYSPCYHAKLHG